MRIIPKKTKISIELFKGITIIDVLVGLLFIGFAVLAFTSGAKGGIYIAAALIITGTMLLVHIGDEPNYMFFLAVLRHLATKKSYSKAEAGDRSIENISAFKKIEDGYIVYKDYYGAAIEIPPVEFRFFSSHRRTISIEECLGNTLRSLNGNYAANLVKLERRVPYDAYIENEKGKVRELRHAYECGLISEEEFQAKCEIVFDRVSELERMNSEERTVTAFYYLVIFDSDKKHLKIQLDSALSMLRRGEMQPRRLDSKGLALFLKYSNEIDFDEKELDGLAESEYARWAMPESLQIGSKECSINGKTAYTMAVTNYPLLVGDAWMAGVMSFPATKVVVKLQPMDKGKTIRNIDHSISELRGRYRQTGVDSTLIEIKDHISSLSKLLSMLQSDNELLFNTDIYVTCYDVPHTNEQREPENQIKTSRANITNMRATVRRIYRESELRLSNLQFRQMEGYIGSQISGYDPLAKSLGIGIPGTTAAAMYPWIYAHVQDPLGVKLGKASGTPVFIDMFRRDSERVNSNVVIVGKTGSGKSYAAKSILVNLAADNSKIFVLDPENEYTELAENLHGKFINVGNAQQGRINPFQIITALEDDDSDGGITGSYASHMQFLEEFYKQILPDCDKDALEYLNTITNRVYMQKGITEETNLGLLSPGDYPTFSDVYNEVLLDFQSTDNEYLRGILRTLMNYVSKFSGEGRNANIWNGPSTVTTEENFTVFNFQSLLAGGNRTVTNAQMLLVMKYIDNEIIKNREYNNRYNTNRRIVVVIDEAHVFIDDKYPIALDFMYQLAKRIRKYNGMQIVITQNIKDFVGSEEISRKSSAIINACQYSFIFPLAPNDMTDLCRLYEKAGGINENEQDKIITAPRGNAFVILGPTSRSAFQVEVTRDVTRLFEQKGAGTAYFAGEEGKEKWEKFLGQSREKYLENRKVRALPAPKEKDDEPKPSQVSFTEISAEEYDREQQAIKEAEMLAVRAEEAVNQLKASVEPAEETPDRQIITNETRSSTGEMDQVVSALHLIVDSMTALSGIMSGLQVPGAAAMAEQAARQAAAIPAEEYIEAETAAGEESYAAPDDGNQDDGDDFDFSSIFEELKAATGENETAAGEAAQQASEAGGEDFDSGNIFESPEGADEDESEEEKTLRDFLKELATDEEAMSDLGDEALPGTGSGSEFDLFEEGEKMDIMAFISQVRDELEKQTVLDDMKTGGETVRNISLEELEKIYKTSEQELNNEANESEP